jgi:23S rRNA pseudouridine1911/1915/1917 synthase
MIVFEDDYILVYNKPVGIVTESNKTFDGDSVTDIILREKKINLFVVSRLDVGTSGLVVFAKTEDVYERLKGMFSSREVKKTYYAIVQGKPEYEYGLIDSPIGRDPSHKFRFTVSSLGKDAQTEYDLVKTITIDNLGKVSLLKAVPKTGRTHQIRVHFKAIGNTLVGDLMYDANKRISDELGVTRPLLHSEKLEFIHPVTQEKMVFEIDFPEDFIDELIKGTSNQSFE